MFFLAIGRFRYGFNSEGHETVLKRLKEREKDKFGEKLRLNVIHLVSCCLFQNSFPLFLTLLTFFRRQVIKSVSQMKI